MVQEIVAKVVLDNSSYVPHTIGQTLTVLGIAF